MGTDSMKRAILRFLVWFRDGQRQTGVVRASNGRFQKVAP